MQEYSNCHQCDRDINHTWHVHACPQDEPTLVAGGVERGARHQDTTYFLAAAPANHTEGVWRLVGVSTGCYDGHKTPQV